jgi:integrase
MPQFMRALAGIDDTAGWALAFDILTVARNGSVQHVTWGQIADDPVFGWTLDGAGREHEGAHPTYRAGHIPVAQGSAQSGPILSTASTGPCRDALIFPNATGKRLYHLSRLMPKLGFAAYTPHGFWATYRTWATETFKVRDYGHEIVEQVLAHKIRDKAEAAYARAEALVLRRKLMEEWAAACGTVAMLSVVSG